MLYPAQSLYNIPLSKYVNIKAGRLLSRFWWLAALVLIVLGIAALGDNRYAYLALMVAMVVYPMVFSFVWLTISAQPAMSTLTRPQSVAFTDDSITVKFFPHEIDEDNFPEPVHTLIIYRDMISGYEIGKNHTQINLDKQFDFILIPTALLPKDYILFDEL